MRPVALIILDGWGLAPDGPGNAVALANTPNFDRLWAQHPHSTLQASGLAVGLPEGQIGNSEVGHLNLGAGRVVYQDLTRIDLAIKDGAFLANPQLRDALAHARDHDATFHIVGLLSHGGVHSSIAHIEAAVTAAALAGVPRIAVHAITDGRDVAPDAALTDVPAFEAFLARVSSEHATDAWIATVIGRYWAMDRDKRWDRTQRAYDAFVHRVAEPAAAASSAVEMSHAAGITDEFVEPYVLAHGHDGAMRDGDVVFFANFRPDRMRQIGHALLDADFPDFDRGAAPGLRALAMTKYDDTLGIPVVFDQHLVRDVLADVLEREGIAQLHVAETEKYAHVTYFFNGGDEREHAGELRDLVPSPRDVPTYDLKPEMSAHGVADHFVRDLADESIGFGVINFANPDMVGHTGSIPAAVAAIETVDTEFQRVVDAVHARGGVAIVTADHGNAEQMLTPEGKPHTAHTTNPVPVVVTLPQEDERSLRDGGKLGDVAPTVLDLLGIAQPAEMTGTSLLVSAAAAAPGVA